MSVYETAYSGIRTGYDVMQFPCPPAYDSSVPPGLGEQVFLFFLLYGLVLALVTLALPKKWSDRILEIAFLRERNETTRHNTTGGGNDL
jgi:hypothetical protein